MDKERKSTIGPHGKLSPIPRDEVRYRGETPSIFVPPFNIKTMLALWWDNWLEAGPLANLMDNISSLNNLQVSYFINSDNGESLARQHAPPLMVPTILNTHIQHPLRSKLPTNEKLASFWNRAQSHRQFRTGEMISITLANGNFANHIWKVPSTLGIEHSCTTLRCLSMKWRSSQHKERGSQTIKSNTPIFLFA
ncbi:hypothetical protein H5410_027566 [Solanum commersonii]|uniref:Uncharacterized protein n=1 Tax=Solanum commersonii TaxID=4109 RepID=A0A9J5Z076_SOLCO|nr:hypothetical protein H5410_027566 [Solanum commersonii]